MLCTKIQESLTIIISLFLTIFSSRHKILIIERGGPLDVTSPGPLWWMDIRLWTVFIETKNFLYFTMYLSLLYTDTLGQTWTPKFNTTFQWRSVDICDMYAAGKHLLYGRFRYCYIRLIVNLKCSKQIRFAVLFKSR